MLQILPFPTSKRIIFFTGLLILLTSCKKEIIDFNTQVRPIINKNCISCHGGIKQSGGFGLIFREKATGETKNGHFGVVPGFPDKSEMISRINHKDPEMRMPLEKEPLSSEEIRILTKWIKQGAEWKNHWSYLIPEEPEVPHFNSQWTKNDIDNFILEKINVHGLKPSAKADKYDLVRRVYLDLIGLPPTRTQVDEFLSNTSSDTYENLVDQLLISPRFGEHWASMWLDLARFADSRGYEKDGRRIIWKYRDWVINAFNDDMPFDQFTIEQLAGDLLPDPTRDQLIATAFHRNTLNNEEGGTSNEEYRIASVIDRVNTTWEVWQSTTIGCVQCHSHPYDPILQKEYYSSFALFNNTSDWDGPGEHPLLRDFKEEDMTELEEIKEWITNLSTPLESSNWERFILIGEPKIRPEDFDETKNVVHHNRGDQDFMQVFDGSQIRINDMQLYDLDRIYLTYRQRQGTGSLTIRANKPDGQVIGKVNLFKTDGFQTIPLKLKTTLRKADIFLQFESNSEEFICEIDGFLPGKKLPGETNSQYQETYNKIDNLLNVQSAITTPIMVEKPKERSRQTYVFERGNWMVQGDSVSAGVPRLLNSEQNDISDRLEFANWLVSEENPLTARVMVNRFWAKLFGKGIVGTVEDFGALGDRPTHPELLDWLALRFSKDWNWSMKSLIKNIVMSATYRQSSITSDIAREKDPGNRWLSRSPRVRLSAEQIRDQALAVSGLLSSKMYGPSVMPFQPEGVWSIVYSSDSWYTSDGEDAFRRGLYTYLRRSSPYPSAITFDGASREFCVSRRINTNTPLQALVTLNDPVYIEAARNLAKQVLEVDGDKKTKIEWAYSQVMGKIPNEEKSAILMTLLDESDSYYIKNHHEAFEMAKSENMELASMTVVVNALMNLDEFIMKN